MAWCKKNHRYDGRFQNLPESQEFFNEVERHKCAGCAYEQGFNDAINGNRKNIRLNELDQSQAGNVRHKDPVAAYDMEYSDGLNSLQQSRVVSK